MRRGRWGATLLGVALAGSLGGPGALRAEPGAASEARPAPAFSAARAWTHLETLVGFGPRPPGSTASARVQTYVRDQFSAAGAEVHEHRFTAQTPDGPVPMTNVWGVVAGARENVLVLSAHYDTKHLPAAPEFVGANDSASGIAVLLALAEALGNAAPPPLTIWFVCYDGEEAYRRWSDTDGIYGSRAFVAHLQETGELARIEAAMNVDMVGDEHLRIVRETQSTDWLVDRIWETAQRLGHGTHFTRVHQEVTDDHVPFLRAGRPAANLIDFRYGPRSQDNRWWHSADDTLAHCREDSLRIVGSVLLHTIHTWAPPPP